MKRSWKGDADICNCFYADLWWIAVHNRRSPLRYLVRLPDISREYRRVNLLLFLGLLFSLMVPAIFDRSTLLQLVPRCPILQATGDPCPTCGLTRSIAALYEGNITGSLSCHAGGLVLVVITAIQLVMRIIPLIARTSRWVPWLDLGQLIAMYLVFRIAL